MVMRDGVGVLDVADIEVPTVLATHLPPTGPGHTANLAMHVGLAIHAALATHVGLATHATLLQVRARLYLQDLSRREVEQLASFTGREGEVDERGEVRDKEVYRAVFRDSRCTRSLTDWQHTW